MALFHRKGHIHEWFVTLFFITHPEWIGQISDRSRQQETSTDGLPNLEGLFNHAQGEEHIEVHVIGSHGSEVDEGACESVKDHALGDDHPAEINNGGG